MAKPIDQQALDKLNLRLAQQQMLANQGLYTPGAPSSIGAINTALQQNAATTKADLDAAKKALAEAQFGVYGPNPRLGGTVLNPTVDGKAVGPKIKEPGAGGSSGSSGPSGSVGSTGKKFVNTYTDPTTGDVYAMFDDGSRTLMSK